VRKINQFIVHCADTTPDMDIGVIEIDLWHKKRGWSGIGYHFVIRRDGTIEEGCPVEKIGSHVKGHNRYSIGVCLVGGFKGARDFTQEQYDALKSLYRAYCIKYRGIEIFGHNDFTKAKTCPNFDVQSWWSLTEMSEGMAIVQEETQTFWQKIMGFFSHLFSTKGAR